MRKQMLLVIVEITKAMKERVPMESEIEYQRLPLCRNKELCNYGPHMVAMSST